MPAFPCDLHCHTTRSDGRDTPRELIQNAADLGMHVIAMTDHDIGPAMDIILEDGKTAMDAFDFADSLGVTLVRGIEFSTNTWINDVHICGYRMDWAHPDLKAAEAEAVTSKVNGYHELTRRLQAHGMDVDWERDLLLNGDRVPEAVQRKHIFEMIAEKGYTETWADAKVMVQGDAELNVRREKFDPAETIDLIHRLGGTAVLAHPHLIDATVVMPGRDPLSREDYLEELVAAGLDGIEARYTYDKTTYRGGKTPEEIEKIIREAFEGRLAVISGGSDYHAGHRKGVKNPRMIGDKGLTIDEFEALRSYYL